MMISNSVKMKAAQHSVPELHRDNAPDEWDASHSGSLRGLELVPSKWRCLVPPMLRDSPEGHIPLASLGDDDAKPLDNPRAKTKSPAIQAGFSKHRFRRIYVN